MTQPATRDSHYIIKSWPFTLCSLQTLDVLLSLAVMISESFDCKLKKKRFVHNLAVKCFYTMSPILLFSALSNRSVSCSFFSACT